MLFGSQERRATVLDSIYLVLGVLFTVLIWAFALGCARLEKKK